MPRHAPPPDVLAVVTAHAGAHLEAAYAGRNHTRDRAHGAASPWVTPALARRFARSTDIDLRAAVAGNPATPPSLLAKLIHDDRTSVARAAEDNPSTPYVAIIALEQTDLTLAHPDCPADTLTAALRSVWHRDRALTHPNLPAHLVHEAAAGDNPNDPHILLDSPHLTHAEAMHAMARSGVTSHLEWKWAKHVNADPDWLAGLAGRRFDSSGQGTIDRIAANPATPGPVLARILAQHVHRAIAAANPHCPPDALHATLDALHAPRAPRASRTSDTTGTDSTHRRPPLDEVTVSNHRRLLAIIATSPAASSDVLERLPVSALHRDEHLWTFTLTHARTATEARTVLALAPAFTGTLADLLTVTRAITDTDPQLATAPTAP